MYGIEWDGPISEDNSENIHVLGIPCPLAHDDLHVDVRLSPKGNTGSRLFTEVKPFRTGLISGWVTI